jgi:hypothetical protein
MVSDNATDWDAVADMVVGHQSKSFRACLAGIFELC